MRNFRQAKARQPEIIRAVQKDATYSNELSADFSDLLRLTGSRNWIRYNNLCKLFAEIIYHGFASINNLQTLGEEYTGIVQIDSNYIKIPSKILRLIAIILEYGGDVIYFKVLHKLEKDITDNNEIVPEAKVKLLQFIKIMSISGPFIKALHKTLFYFGSSKYQIAKRVTGINYILIRHWLKPDHSLYGYKMLGGLTFLQLTIALLFNLYEMLRKPSHRQHSKEDRLPDQLSDNKNILRNIPQCLLCLEPRNHVSATPCGHLFCWDCILNWLDEKDECPICRESIRKSEIIQLQNFV